VGPYSPPISDRVVDLPGAVVAEPARCRSPGSMVRFRLFSTAAASVVQPHTTQLDLAVDPSGTRVVGAKCSVG